MSFKKRRSAALVGREHFPQVHRLASREHWRSPCKVLCSAHIALCSNNMLSPKFACVRNAQIIAAIWPFDSDKSQYKIVKTFACNACAYYLWQE